MPRYYFPVSDGAAAEPDMEGVELDSLEEVRASAVRALVELARDVLDGDSQPRVLTVEVLDEQGRSLFRGRLRFDNGEDAPG